MCNDCQRKDRVIEGLKESVKDNYKQARLETVTALYDGIKYSTPEKKQQVIESLANSKMEIDDITIIASDIKRFQGIHNHYH